MAVGGRLEGGEETPSSAEEGPMAGPKPTTVEFESTKKSGGRGATSAETWADSRLRT